MEYDTASETHTLEKNNIISMFLFFRGRSMTSAIEGQWPSGVKALQ